MVVTLPPMVTVSMVSLAEYQPGRFSLDQSVIAPAPPMVRVFLSEESDQDMFSTFPAAPQYPRVSVKVPPAHEYAPLSLVVFAETCFRRLGCAVSMAVTPENAVSATVGFVL